jgi:AcrR family transcriptional regulator
MEHESMIQPGPRRRPETGGYARGDEKQARIIKAALRRFGEHGYEGASTRQIAADAGVNPPALQYYFNGKEGLYLACGEYIAQCFVEAMRVAYLRSGQVARGDREAALDALCDILDAIADFLFETAETDGWSRFLARVQNKDGQGPTNQALGETIEDELYAHCNRLVGLVVGQPPSDVGTRLRTTAIMGQLMAFHLGRDAALKRLNWPDLSGRRLRRLKDMLRVQTRAALGVA